MRKISSQTPSGTRSIVKGLLCSTAVAALIASAPAQANDMDEMRTELQNLLDRMERVEQTQVEQQDVVTTAAPLSLNRQYIRKRAQVMRGQYAPYDVRDLYIMPETARANGVVGGDLPGSFKLPGSDTSLAISGAIQMGVSYDGGTSEGAFQTWGHAGLLVPDGGGANSSGGSLRFESISNGVNFSSSSESSMGAVTSSLSLWSDLAAPGAESTLNLVAVRASNASIGMGNWTFGLQGLAFTSGSCYGETVATGGAPCPLGSAPAIQYAGGGGGMNYRVQLVHPVAQLDAAGLTAVGGSNINGSLPDLQARISSDAGGANVSVGLQLRQYGYDSKGGNLIAVPGTSDNDVGWGIFPEVKIPMGNDSLYAGVAYTDGGRNTSINWSLWTGGRGEEGTVNPTTGKVDGTKTMSIHTYYTHAWSDTSRSTLHVSGGNTNPGDFTLGAAAAPPLTKWRSVTGNIVWSLVPRITTGVGITYNSALFRGDNGNTAAVGDEANTAIEGHWKVSVSY